MFTRAELEEFQVCGFIMGPKVLSDDHADALRDRMMSVLEGRSQGKPELNRNMLGEASPRVVYQIVNIWEADDLFREHIYNVDICALTAQLVGVPVLWVWDDQCED